ncbi:MAG: hypothetical protein L0Z62_27935 [Gemmataceae bacterium]|nr:hypothetical protein [Gemmataceae bacterium]
MSAIKDANLELLTELNKHLDHAAQLRTILDRLASLAKAPAADNDASRAPQSQDCEVPRAS